MGTREGWDLSHPICPPPPDRCKAMAAPYPTKKGAGAGSAWLKETGKVCSLAGSVPPTPLSTAPNVGSDQGFEMQPTAREVLYLFPLPLLTGLPRPALRPAGPGPAALGGAGAGRERGRLPPQRGLLGREQSRGPREGPPAPRERRQACLGRARLPRLQSNLPCFSSPPIKGDLQGTFRTASASTSGGEWRRQRSRLTSHSFTPGSVLERDLASLGPSPEPPPSAAPAMATIGEGDAFLG